jgi:hypothetical protein
MKADRDRGLGLEVRRRDSLSEIAPGSRSTTRFLRHRVRVSAGFTPGGILLSSTRASSQWAALHTPRRRSGCCSAWVADVSCVEVRGAGLHRVQSGRWPECVAALRLGQPPTAFRACWISVVIGCGVPSRSCAAACPGRGKLRDLTIVHAIDPRPTRNGAARCARTCRTVHPAHRLGWSQSCGGNTRSRSTKSSRSAQVAG